jgi:serine protease AprX
MHPRRLIRALSGLTALLLGTAPAAGSPLGTYIVTYDLPPTAAQMEVLSGVALSQHALRHVPAALVVLPAADAGVLTYLPGVRRVYPNRAMVPLLRQSTRVIGADHAWEDLDITGAGIGIAIIDTGIDGTHPDLCAAPAFCQGTPVKTVQNVKLIGRQDVGLDPVLVLENQINSDTSSGHGSHVAGIAAGLGVASAHEYGKYRGVAPGARLIGLGTGEAVEAVNVLAAFDWVLEHKDDPRYNIKVINNSWGPGKGHPFDPEEPVQRAIAAAHDAGLTVVFGAGNDGPVTDTMNAFSVNPKAIAVASGIKPGHISFFSSRGSPGHPLWQPTLTAPGSNIAAARASTGFLSHVADALAPNPDPIQPPDTLYYASGSGTSMASPHVAGIVALMQQAAFQARGVYLTPQQVRNILQNTAVSRDAVRGPGGLPLYQHYSMGAGYADARAAVQAAADGSALQAYASGVNYDVRGFSGSLSGVMPAFETSVPVATGALSLDLMVDWLTAVNDVDVELYRPDGSLHSSTFMRCNPDGEPNGYSSFCTQQANERSTAVQPQAGTWRAVVKGAFAAVDTVRGVWSVAYATGAAMPPPQAVASVTLEPSSTISVSGRELELKATLRDSNGHPVPNAAVHWSSAGVGALSLTESTTRADGSARARTRSAQPGAQTVTATSGTHAVHSAITWLGITLPDPQQSTPGKASGGGWFMDSSKRSFGFWAEYIAAAGGPAGELSFRDRDVTTIHGKGVTRLLISGNGATVHGHAAVNGVSGYRYRLDVVDRGEPGRDDSFRLIVTRDLNPLYRYETGGTLGGGNIQVGTYPQ